MIYTVKLLLTSLLVIFIYVMYKQYCGVHYEMSNVDNKYYKIRIMNKSRDFYKESADIMANINLRIEKLIDHLVLLYSDDASKNYFIRKLRQNYTHDILSEATIDKRYTTYTIDKSEMHICLRSRDKTESLYNIEVLMYVVLHELAHLCNYNKSGYPIIGHGAEFKNIFEFLVKEAIKIGVYKDQRFDVRPQEYCDIIINSNII